MGLGKYWSRQSEVLQFQLLTCFLRLSSLKAMRREMGLLRTREQNHTLESIQPALIEMRKRYPKAGARDMTSILFHEKGMCVPR